jgi:TolB protein
MNQKGIAPLIIVIVAVVVVAIASVGVYVGIRGGGGGENHHNGVENLENENVLTSGIVFVSGREGGAIYVMDENGGNVRRIGSDTGVVDDYPSVSSDGTKIVFTEWGLWVKNVDGTGKTKLVDDVYVTYPTWSPDGNKIYYMSSAGGNELIFCVNADGTGKTQISPPYSGTYNVMDRHPSISPDGTKIAFTTGRKNIGGHENEDGVAIMNVDGSGLTLLPTGYWEDTGVSHVFRANPMVGGNSNPGVSWSPDGSKLVFQGYPYPSEQKTQIYVMNSNGTGLTQLTFDTTSNCYGPAWSPDGTKIVFWKGLPPWDAGEIYIMNSDGSSQKALTDQTVTGDDRNPCFIGKPR